MIKQSTTAEPAEDDERLEEKQDDDPSEEEEEEEEEEAAETSNIPTTYASIARVQGSYTNEFALTASAEVMSVASFALAVAVLVPTLSWALVPTTTGAVFNVATNSTYFPVTIQEWSLFTQSCSTPGMAFTYSESQCSAANTAVAVFAVLACVFEILSVFFGIMPFSPVFTEPKKALTHAMLSQMFASLFALITWTVFYGALVNNVWKNPTAKTTCADNAVAPGFKCIPFESNVTVTYGGFMTVCCWVASFFAWLLALSAMIKYDEVAAEQAIVNHQTKKEEYKRRKELLIVKLAKDHSKQGIPLELPDKLYIGGTISCGACAAIAWANLAVVPELLKDPRAVALTAGAIIIIMAIALVTSTVVLIMGLVDLIPRVKASIGAFAVCSLVTILWITSFAMTLSVQQRSTALNRFEIAIGSIGCACTLGTTMVLYHPFRIWETSVKEIPRPAKQYLQSKQPERTLGLIISSVMFAFIALSLYFGGVGAFTYTEEQFIGYRPVNGSIPGTTPTRAPTAISTSLCPDNVLGARCNIGSPSQIYCCVHPLVCYETAYTEWTCQQLPFYYDYFKPRTSFPVGQAFLALSLASSIITFVFAVLANSPIGVIIQTTTALAITFGFGFIQCATGVISYAVLQNFILASGGYGMPQELGFIIGGFVASLVCAVCAVLAWYQLDPTVRAEEETEMKEAKKQLQLEKIKLEIARVRKERMELENV